MLLECGKSFVYGMVCFVGEDKYKGILLIGKGCNILFVVFGCFFL